MAERSVDVLVVGGGALGCAHAIAAVRAGMSVELCERHAAARGASVRNAVIGPGATVCEGAVVDGSLLGHGARVEPGATVSGLSILGDGAVVAANVVLDGAKVPEAD